MDEKFKTIELLEIMSDKFYKWKREVRLNGEEEDEIESIICCLRGEIGRLFNIIYKEE